MLRRQAREQYAGPQSAPAELRACHATHERLDLPICSANERLATALQPGLHIPDAVAALHQVSFVNSSVDRVPVGQPAHGSDQTLASHTERARTLVADLDQARVTDAELETGTVYQYSGASFLPSVQEIRSWLPLLRLS
jgi:hypothetical protein